MTPDQISYLIFGIVLLLALVFDLGLMSKKNSVVTIKQALIQTCFWVLLAFAFFFYLLIENGTNTAVEYISAYLMEWSLSIDNIFVFILIFASFGIKQEQYGRVLLIGVILAVALRIIFITLGVALVEKAEWILYIFGVFLVYTGIQMFRHDQDEEVDPHENKVYRLMQRLLPLTTQEAGSKMSIRIDGKKFYTRLFVVVVLVATTDIVFALDSIPAVFGIVSKDSPDRDLIIYTSNIFAVLGLRSLFFLLRGAVSKFDYLPKGIAVVLVFIGLKMLAAYWIHLPVWISLTVIIVCLAVSVVYSVHKKNQGVPEDYVDPPNAD